MAASESGATAACVPCAARPGTSRPTSSRDGDRSRAGGGGSPLARRGRGHVARGGGGGEGASPARSTAGHRASTRGPAGPGGHGGRRLVLERGGPTLWLPWPSWNCLTRELHSGLEAPVGQDPAWKAGRRRRRGRRGCGASSLSPNQAISLQSAAGALGAHTAQDLPPGGEPASSPYFSAPAPGPSPPWMWAFGWVRGFSLSPRRRRWRRRWRRVPHSPFSPQGASAFAYCLLSFGRRSGDRSFLLSKSLERFGVAPSWAGQGESRLLLDKLSSLDSLIWGAVPVKDLSCPHPHRSWDRAVGQSAPRFRI